MSNSVDNTETNYNGFPSEYERNAVLKLLEELEVFDGTAEVDGTTNAGDNYIGEIRKVKAAGKTKSGQEFNLRLIYKSAPSVENRVSYIKLLFDREIIAYENILPALHQVQLSENIDPDQRFYTARCYKTISEHLHETLILEDVSAHGFKMGDRTKSMDWNQVSLVMKNLARVHGTSHVMKERNPEELQMLAASCKELVMDEKWFSEESDGKRYHFYNIDMTVKSLTNLKHAQIVEGLKSKIDKMMYEIMIPQDDSTSVICYGDAWTNNILFDYKDGVPTNVCFVDWQIIRYGSPHLDIFYFITLCTDGKFKKEFWDRAFEYYHDSLRDYLKLFKVDVENVYPKVKFLQDRKKFAIFGLYWAMVLLPFMLNQASNPDDESNQEITDDGTVINKVYKARINEVVEDFIRLGYIS